MRREPDQQRERGAISLWVGVTVAVTLALAAVFASRWFGSLSSVRHMEQTFWQRSLAESAVHLALARVNASDSYAGVTTETMTVAVVKPSEPPTLDSPSADLAACLPEDWRQITVRLPSGRHWQATAKAHYEPLFRTLIDASERVELQEVSTSSRDWEKPDPKRANGGEETRWGDLIAGQVVLRAINPQVIGGDVLCGPNGSLVLDPTVSVTGERRTLAKPWKRKPMPEAQGAILPYPEGKMIAIPGGQYRTSGLYVQKPSRYALRGPTKIHVDGNAVIGVDTLMAGTGHPSDLVLIVHGSQVEVHLPFSGGIFAPNAEVTLHGTGHFGGAIVAKSVRNTGQAKLVFDRSLVRKTRGDRLAYHLVGMWPEWVPGEWASASDAMASDVAAAGQAP
jgi:hypothetical protein